MPHAVFTIVTQIRDGHEESLRDVLSRIEGSHEANGLLNFTDFPELHFSSFTIIPPGPKHPQLRPMLVFENVVDGTRDDYLRNLVERHADGLGAIYAHCAGSPEAADGSERHKRALLQYLRCRAKRPTLHHVGTPYRSAACIVANQRLRVVIDRALDARRCDAGDAPEAVWHAVREAVNVPGDADQDLSPDVDLATGNVRWVRRPEPRRETQIGRWAVAGLIAVALLSVLLAVIMGLWTRPVLLCAGLALVSLGVGMWLSILLGWPVQAGERGASMGPADSGADWANTVNIWIWFAAIGWGLGLIPSAAAVAGVHWPGSAFWPAASLAVLALVTLARAVSAWPLPTPVLDRPRPDADLLDRVTTAEDRLVVNHMSAMVMLRGGTLRAASLWLLLTLLEHTWFHTVLADRSKGRLFSFSTVHFAQWVMLGQGQYMFLSNYDHSWSRYLDDFGRLTFGLARLWGQGTDSPGHADLERFKDFARGWMKPHQVWYRAYPQETVTQAWNHDVLRRALLAPPGQVDAPAMLRRLVVAPE